MKSQHQTLRLLAHYYPKSVLDEEMIRGFLNERFGALGKTEVFNTSPDAPKIGAGDFAEWFEKGFGIGDTAIMEGKTVILGDAWLDKYVVAGEERGKCVVPSGYQAKRQELSECDAERHKIFLKRMLCGGLQFSIDEGSLEEKYVPSDGDKVLFHDMTGASKGIGIVRHVSPSEREIELYCYFIYPTKMSAKGIGFSMHERSAISMEEFVFEPLGGDDTHPRKLDPVSCMRRLNRELEKYGKVWKDKLRRVEPLNMRAQKGGTYWYINDKLKVVKAVEKDTPTCHMRYLSGNYFIDETAALVIAGEVNDLIRVYLASPGWPRAIDFV